MNRKFVAALYIKDAKTLPLWIENKVHTPENLPPVHSHDFAELVYVVHGRAQHLFEGNYYDIMAGDVIMIKPEDNHTYIMKNGALKAIMLPRLSKTSKSS